MGEDEDPRKNIKQFEGKVFVDEDNGRIVKIIFSSKADLLDARYELVDCNNPILVFDPGEIDEGDNYAVIEPSRVQSSTSIELRAKEEE